ncbi:hypothetical protein DL96DRAFT_1611037 [Flagelloscypha sp. PMI_526]|nr:hypothetical protein DL96DRAFT_1611037 [Flagelloscypha sp. PMI_526]
MTTTAPLNLLELIEGPKDYSPISDDDLAELGFTRADKKHRSQLTLYSNFWGQRAQFSSGLRSLNVEGIGLREDILYVFDSYIRALTLIKAKRERFFHVASKPDRRLAEVYGCLILGTPGIGKSTLLLLYLIISLALEHPILILMKGVLYFHTPKGVFTSETKLVSIVDASALFGLTFLVDLDVILDHGVGEARKVWCIGAASPHADGQQKFRKNLRAHRIVLDNPKIEELFGCYDINSQSQKDELSMSLDIIGPNMRELHDFSNSRNRSFLDNAMQHIDALSSTELSEMFKIIQHSTPSTNSFSHAICISEPHIIPDPDLAYTRDTIRYRVRSLTVMRLITRAYQKNRRRPLHEFYVTLHADRNLGTAKGWVFESLCHDAIANGVGLTLCQMKEVGDELHRTWREDSGIKIQTLSIQKRPMSIFLSTTPKSATYDLGKYYVPAEANNHTFDGFLHGNDSAKTLHAFQMSIGFKHTMKTEGLQRLTTRAYPGAPIQLIFLIVPGSPFKVSKPPKFYQSKFQFFTCELSFDLPGSAFNFAEGNKNDSGGGIWPTVDDVIPVFSQIKWTLDMSSDTSMKDAEALLKEAENAMEVADNADTSMTDA